MRKFLTILLSIAFLSNAGAATFGLYTYTINADDVSVTITDYPTTATGALEIPATIDGRSVTSIGSYAFSSCSGLTSITIPDSVTSIGDGAFSSCSGLTSITIPDSVTSIGDKAFRSCSNLTSITIPDSVTSIGRSAFNGCSNLTSITIPDSVTSIGDYAFQDCSSLTSMTIGNGVTSIGMSSFKNTALNYHASQNGLNYLISTNGQSAYLIDTSAATGAVVIPEFVNGASVKAFTDFYTNASITSVTIPDSVTIIGASAFSNCSSLTSITIPDSVTSIGDYAFRECSSLTSITIPDSVTSIGASAFSYCTSLTSITIPDSVTSIGDYTFSDCTSLTSITIPDSVTSIGASAFSNCSSLTSITIPDSVTSIGNEVFYNCSNLTSVTLPYNFANTVEAGVVPEYTFGRIVDALKNDADFVAAVAQSMLAAENNSGFATKAELPRVEQAGIDQVLASPASYDLATTAEVTAARIDGQQDVLSAPASYELYDESSIIELNVATPLLSMTNDDNQAEVEFAIETSDDLQTWSVEERIQRTLAGQGEKYFVRVTTGAPYIEPEVSVYSHPTLGDILTNADGAVLYAFVYDSAGQDPAYTGSAWPLVASSDAPEPDADVTASLAGATFSNVSGGPWLTMNGLPVYTYVSDSAPHEATGHGVGDVWFTIRADGSVNQP